MLHSPCSWGHSPADSHLSLVFLGLSSASTRGLPGGRRRGTCSLFVVCAAKKEKKKKRAKGSPVSHDQGGPSPQGAVVEAVPAPKRILPHPKLSLKAQQRIVAAYSNPGPAAPKRKQTWRKAKPDREQLAREAEAAQQEEATLKEEQAKDTAKLSYLRNLYNTANNFNPPIVLVDAYNVLAEWSRFRLPDDDQSRRSKLVAMRACMREGNIDYGRGLLIADLENYSAANGVKVILVFDAMGNPMATENQRMTSTGGLDIVYCGRSEADTFIMLEVKRLMGQNARQVLVVSSDMELFESGWGCGSYAISSSMFLAEVDKARRDTNQRLLELQDRSHCGRIGEQILSQNPEVYKKLAAMRRQL